MRVIRILFAGDGGARSHAQSLKFVLWSSNTDFTDIFPAYVRLEYTAREKFLKSYYPPFMGIVVEEYGLLMQGLPVLNCLPLFSGKAKKLRVRRLRTPIFQNRPKPV